MCALLPATSVGGLIFVKMKQLIITARRTVQASAPVIVLALALILAACDRDEVNPGEVAVVNGTPITLKQLQSVHDTLVISGDSPNRSVEALRAEYGSVLSEMIIQELVVQELERKKMAVTPEEQAAFEEELLQDFPPEGFERMLLEESIDVDMWRASLYRRLSMEKFNNLVLRPQVSITAEEVEGFYLKYQDEFKIPERINFIQFSSLIKDQAVSAAEQFRKKQDPAAIQARFQNMSIRMVVMREDRLAPELVSALSKLKPGEASPPLELNGEYVTIVLLGTEKSRLLSREEMYSRIESIILEDKIQSVFQQWLERKLEKSSIKVSRHLLPDNLR